MFAIESAVYQCCQIAVPRLPRQLASAWGPTMAEEEAECLYWQVRCLKLKEVEPDLAYMRPRQAPQRAQHAARAQPQHGLGAETARRRAPGCHVYT